MGAADAAGYLIHDAGRHRAVAPINHGRMGIARGRFFPPVQVYRTLAVAVKEDFGVATVAIANKTNRNPGAVEAELARAAGRPIPPVAAAVGPVQANIAPGTARAPSYPAVNTDVPSRTVSRSSRRRILPTGDLGRASRNSIWRGVL